MNIKIRQPFQHRENYGIFNQILDNNGMMTIRTDEINKVTYKPYFKYLVNFMVDGIETPIWHGDGKVHVIFTDGASCILTINDFLLNFILWYMAVDIETPITSDFLYWEEYVTNKTIAKYINRCFVSKTRRILTNQYMNNIIADCTDRFSIIDKISEYLSDSINFYDDIQLMKKCPEYYDCLHLDISRQPIDKVRSVIDKTVEKAVQIIKNSDKFLGYFHSLASNFMTGEALNKKQFAETYIGIGVKPNPFGGVINVIISNSFLNGGVTNDIFRYVESMGGRQASVISHKSVSRSGQIAKQLGLNNQTSFLHSNPYFCCNTRNLIPVYIDSFDTLLRLDLRYYKLSPNGVKKRLRFTDIDLIGKIIYLYSPMTCASAAAGQGICYQCYGDLAYVNSDINIGIFAANELSNEFTQRMLSAKHILETIITVIKWAEGFDDYFTVETDQIIFNADKANNGVKIQIKIDDIQQEDEFDEDDDESTDNNSRYYLTEFLIIDPARDEKIIITSDDSDKMYLTEEMYDIISKQIKKTDGDTIEIDVSSVNLNMFSLDVDSSGLNKTLENVKNIIDKVAVTSSLSKEEFLAKIIESLNEAKIKMNSVHFEVLLANQIRSKKDVLSRPAWEYDDPEYQILSLRQSLNYNPSPIISLAYQDVANQLNSSVLTSRKSAPSVYDLNVLKYPQKFMETISIEKEPDDDGYEMSVSGIDAQVNTVKLIDPFVIKSNKMTDRK